MHDVSLRLGFSRVSDKAHVEPSQQPLWHFGEALADPVAVIIRVYLTA